MLKPERVAIDAGVVTISALTYGPADGPAVILLHGWADSAWSMDCVARPLAGERRVVSIDLRGHGHSDRGPYNMINLIGDLRAVVERLEVPEPVIIGHSLGGQVAAQFSGLFPEVPSAVVLIEGVGPPPHRLADVDPGLVERQYSRGHVDRTRQVATARPLSGIAEAKDRLRKAHPLLDEERATLLATENTVATDDGGRVWRFDPSSRDWFNGHSQAVAALRWQGITCPVLVINGGDSYERYWKVILEDPQEYPAPLAGAALAERLSHFRTVEYVEIAGAGHMLPYDRPDRLNVVIGDFLSGLSE